MLYDWLVRIESGAFCEVYEVRAKSEWFAEIQAWKLFCDDVNSEEKQLNAEITGIKIDLGECF